MAEVALDSDFFGFEILKSMKKGSVFMVFASIHDIKASLFADPLVFANQDVALRWFRSRCSEVPVIKDNPEDFELVILGSWESSEGSFKPLPVPLRYSAKKLLEGDFNGSK